MPKMYPKLGGFFYKKKRLLINHSSKNEKKNSQAFPFLEKLMFWNY